MKLGSIEYFKDMYEKMTATITPEALERRFKYAVINPEEFKAEFEGDTKEFRKFCYDYAQSLVPGRVSAALYSAVVSAIAKRYGVDHQVKAGYCLLTSSSTYKETKENYLKKRKSGGDMLVTHVYVEVGDKTYDYYGGFDKDVDHVDCERIDNV